MANTSLPILMYHNVTSDMSRIGRLTISVSYLEQQFIYLLKKGYKTYHLNDLENLKTIPAKSIVLTFDDVTVNQCLYVLPLLKKYNLKATFFVPFAYIGKTDEWNNGIEPIMTIDQLKGLGALVELGFHSFMHRAYSSLTNMEINDDFDACFDVCEKHGLKVFNAVAYPYGNFPKAEPVKSSFFACLKQNKMRMGLRIGNRLNKFPFKNIYEIQRIDVRGNEKMWKFKLNLKYGKLF